MSDWRRAVVRVWHNSPKAGGTYKGTAFLVGPAHMITCNHVVHDIPDTAVYLEGPPWAGVQRVTIVKHHPARDIALLMLERSLEDTSLIVLSNSDPQIDDTLTLAGYETADKELDTPSLSVSSYDGEHHSYVLHTCVGPGMSGGPALREGRLVGVTQARDTDRARTYVIPLMAFEDLLSDAGVNLSAHPPLSSAHPPLLTQTPITQTIARFLKDRTVILFVGHGLFPQFYCDLSNRLHDAINRTGRRTYDIRGLPCPTCGERPDHRPKQCPMLATISAIGSSTPHLIDDQVLAVSVANLRAYADHIAAADNLGTLYNRLYETAGLAAGRHTRLVRDSTMPCDSTMPSESSCILRGVPDLLSQLTYHPSRTHSPYILLTPNVDNLLEQTLSTRLPSLRYHTLVVDESDTLNLSTYLSLNTDVLIVRLFGQWSPATNARFAITSDDILRRQKYLRERFSARLTPIAFCFSARVRRTPN